MSHSRRWTAHWLCSSTSNRTSVQTALTWTRSWSPQRVRMRGSGSTNTSGSGCRLPLRRKSCGHPKCVLVLKTHPPFNIWSCLVSSVFRQFCLELNGLAVKLQGECHPDTCTQMTATEQWIFLCAAHKTPKECPAIDYTRHTLDGAACLLNSNKYFPSRVSIKESSVGKLGSVCRRIYRIFSHAYFHHRQIFDKYENETFLCHRFTRFVMKYNLMSKDNLIVPIMEDETNPNEAEGESDA
uniref:MOB-like protein phocein n=1 Tax=Oncorhynchus kisutch TaxID=8019 RepID=A0A8C7JXL5_ONCKI